MRARTEDTGRPRKIVRYGILIAVAAALVAAAMLTCHLPADGHVVRLFYTATVHGNLEPCGCPVNPSGGVARRAYYLDTHKADSGAVVLLDGGDAIGPPTRKGLLQTEYLLRAMQKMGYRVLGVGSRDFSFGLDYLKAAEHDFGFTFTCCNLVTTGTGDFVFPPYAIIRVGRGSFFGIPYGGLRVGIISVLGYDRQPLCPACKPSLALVEPGGAVERTVAAIRSDVDLVVVLAYVDQKDFAWIMNVPGVDVVIATRTLYVPMGFDNVGMKHGVAYGYTGYEGRRVGRMRIVRAPDGSVVSASGDLDNLGMNMPDDPVVARLVAEYKRKLAALPAGTAP